MEQARISPLDRGFLFADSVYEVVLVRHGHACNLGYHLGRLQDSLDGLQLPNPFSDAQWRDRIDRLLEKNRHPADACLYIQISRGVMHSRALIQPPPEHPTVFVFLDSLPQSDSVGIRAATTEDLRWRRCNVKGTGLTANLLMRLDNRDADEVIMHRNGEITEASSSNVFALCGDEVITPPLSSLVLPGVTRLLTLKTLKEQGIDFAERCLSLKALKNAREIWVSNTTRGLAPVLELDLRPVGPGEPGPLWQRIHPLLEKRRSEA